MENIQWLASNLEALQNSKECLECFIIKNFIIQRILIIYLYSPFYHHLIAITIITFMSKENSKSEVSAFSQLAIKKQDAFEKSSSEGDEENSAQISEEQWSFFRFKDQYNSIDYTQLSFQPLNINLPNKRIDPELTVSQKHRQNIQKSELNNQNVASQSITEQIPRQNQAQSNNLSNENQKNKISVSYISNFYKDNQQTIIRYERSTNTFKWNESNSDMQSLYAEPSKYGDRNNKTGKGKTMQSLGLLKIDKKKYKQISLKVRQQAISIQNIKIEFTSVVKLKIFPEDPDMQNHFLMKIYLTDSKQAGDELFVALEKPAEGTQFPIPYFVFAKIIIKKLKSLGIDSITEWQSPDYKPEHFYFEKMCALAKKQINMTKKNQIFSQGEENEGNENEKKPIKVKAKTFIHGQIYKKSKYKGKWEKRYVIINELGIYSFKNRHEKNASVKIKSKDIQYIWTWFSILITDDLTNSQHRYPKEYNENQAKDRISSKNTNENIFLILKIMKGIGQKTEFAIPICNFDAESNKKNWLFACYRLLLCTKKEN